MNPLRDDVRTALVTGASSGLGLAFASALAAEGVEVIGTSRNPNAAAKGPVGEWLKLDLAEAGAADRFMAENPELTDRVDLLVNNAGAGLFGAFETLESNAIRKNLHLLLVEPMVLSRAFVSAWRPRDRGVLVNVASLAARLPIPFMASYDAAKAGLSQFSRALQMELADSKIRVLDFQPGDFRTSFNEAMQPRDAQGPSGVAWEKLERFLRSGPEAEQAARDLIRALRSGRGGRFTTGGFFQTRVATAGHRLLPESWMRKLIRRYYGLS